jgi:Flp pilus assembly pilin Flp
VKSVYARMAIRTNALLGVALAATDDEGGQAATEYCVVLTLIGVSLILTIGTLRGAIIGVVSHTAGAI